MGMGARQPSAVCPQSKQHFTSVGSWCKPRGEVVRRCPDAQCVEFQGMHRSAVPRSNAKNESAEFVTYNLYCAPKGRANLSAQPEGGAS